MHNSSEGWNSKRVGLGCSQSSACARLQRRNRRKCPRRGRGRGGKTNGWRRASGKTPDTCTGVLCSLQCTDCV
ncbi:hypothetical protein LX32DRAFT_216073 [Colletotrichum zoysiae]|uniref:Uncharacterized protein n=1 Tax=Colletotrichum zoysiae TaxID=1216348 RepID=A0AAD9H3Z4_9PEZI|nr:hypothetical protein LX32DRAFT_216073 [Colletotrichum zoysiae]